MTSPVFLSSRAPFLSQFVQYKRALNRKYRADAEVLRLFDRYLQSRHIADWSAIDGALIDDFLKSRPRVRPTQLQPSSWSRSAFFRLRRHAAMDTTESRRCLSSP